MATTIQVIANLLQVDDEEAERFFREVQAHFEGEAPEYALIVQVIRDNQTERLTPEEVALIATTKARAKTQRTANSQSDGPRGARESLDKCPHGVSRGQLCHICRREGARGPDRS